MIKLDIGCGYKIKKGFIGIDNYSLDIAMFNEMNEEDKKRLIIADVQNLPFEDNSVDEIVSERCIIDYVKLEDCVNELKRVMKKDAKLKLLITYRWYKVDIKLLKKYFKVYYQRIKKWEGEDEDSWEVRIHCKR